MMEIFFTNGEGGGEGRGGRGPYACVPAAGCEL